MRKTQVLLNKPTQHLKHKTSANKCVPRKAKDKISSSRDQMEYTKEACGDLKLKLTICIYYNCTITFTNIQPSHQQTISLRLHVLQDMGIYNL